MDSLNILKQELINQKNLLDQKGFPVTTQHTNPSPSEITAAIESIGFDFASANASEEDVAEGKTFYAQTGDLKTGTLNLSQLQTLSDLAISMITGSQPVLIHIPTDSKYTHIRNYAYCNDFNANYTIDNHNDNLFYKHNLTLPSNITRAGVSAFSHANLTGKVTVPETCLELGTYCFAYTNITEAEVHNGYQLNNASAGTFAYCPNLRKATFYPPVKLLPANTFSTCSALEEVYLPATLSDLQSSAFYKCYDIKLIKFAQTTPPTLSSSALKYSTSAVILVPYLNYSAYKNSTNYTVHGNIIMGHGDFATGSTLPSSITGYSIQWYTTLDNAKSSTNPVTTCPATGTMYAVFTAL